MLLAKKMATFLDDLHAAAVVRLRLTAYFRSWHQNQHSKSFLLMCGLHKQIMNGLMTIDLHLSKAENQGQKRPCFSSARFQAKILFYKKCFKSGSITPNPNSYVTNVIFKPYLSFIGLSKATYHCISNIVRGTPKCPFYIAIN